MPNVDSMAKPVPRRTMTLFFLIDISGSMAGDKIGSVNYGIRDTIEDIKLMTNPDAQVKIASLAFSNEANWMTPSPVAIDDYVWKNLEAEGITELGEACEKLNEKLSKNAFMGDATGNYAPAIILISDGNPTDFGKYKYDDSLAKLQSNNWFKQAIKVAFAVGNDVNQEILERFTGTPETVISIHNKSQLERMIKFVSVRASKIASKSSSIKEDTSDSDLTSKQQEVIDALKEADLDSDTISDDEVEWKSN